jgi:hypothetical protein
MGGLHSGRTRKHTCINDCIVLDLAQLKKKKLLTPGYYRMQARHWTETNYIERKEHSSHFQMHVTDEQIALAYQTAVLDTDQIYTHNHAINLTKTDCNYGGARLWFLAPCCGARVRVLYINRKCDDMKHMTPQCRNCLDLHYASQMASYIEQHKTYERHLLANYGYCWAAFRYDFELKAHYLPMTLELQELKLRSQLDRQLEVIRLLMRMNRLFRREHSRALNSLRDEDDQRMYTAHLLEEWGPGHVLEVIDALTKLEVRDVAEQELTRWVTAGEKSKAPLDLARMIAFKEQMEEDLATLKAA